MYFYLSLNGINVLEMKFVVECLYNLASVCTYVTFTVKVHCTARHKGRWSNDDKLTCLREISRGRGSPGSPGAATDAPSAGGIFSFPH